MYVSSILVGVDGDINGVNQRIKVLSNLIIPSYVIVRYYARQVEKAKVIGKDNNNVFENYRSLIVYLNLFCLI